MGRARDPLAHMDAIRVRSSAPVRHLGGGSALEDELLGRPQSMTAGEVVAMAGAELEDARRLWHALGFSDPDPDRRAFTQADVHALRALEALISDGVVDRDTAVAMMRSVGRMCGRLASWQVQLVAERVQAESRVGTGDASDSVLDPPDPLQARAAGHRIAELAGVLEPLVAYGWRRHLATQVGRMIEDAQPVEGYQGVQRVVGFGDLVGFTELVRHSSERKLGAVVEQFEALTNEIITARGARVVKTIGDEVLFLCDDAESAVHICSELVKAVADDPLLPQLRVGAAMGRVLLRLGDVYGTTVNRAARLVSLAEPRGIIIDSRLGKEMLRHPSVEMTPLGRRTLRGIGLVNPWSVEPASVLDGPELVRPAADAELGLGRSPYGLGAPPMLRVPPRGRAAFAPEEATST